MFLEILTPLTFLKTASTIAVAIIGCMAGLHKTIKKVYRIFYVKMITLLVLVGGITLFCVTSVTSNFGSIALLEIGHRIDQIKLESRITKLKAGLDNVYKELGRSVYNRQQLDELMNRAMMMNAQISRGKGESYELSEKFKERIEFENVLRDLHSARIATRLKAIGELGMMEKSKSMPYLLLCTIDTNQAVSNAAAEAISALDRQPFITTPDLYAVDGGTVSAAPCQIPVPSAGQAQAVTPVVQGIPLNKNNGGDF